MSHRNSHYWLWFLLFGAIPFISAAIHGFPHDLTTYTAYWLLGTGVVGLLIGNHNVNEGRLARPYDLIVGILFTVAGVVGILNDFNVAVGGVASGIQSIGLSLSALYPYVYTFLGLKSLHHGLDKGK